jgi:hypothetical protein
MKKQELIHLHGLLAEVSNHCEMANDVTIDLEEYHELGIKPTSIHKSKTDHKDAVFAIATGITSRLEAEEREATPPSAD